MDSYIEVVGSKNNVATALREFEADEAVTVGVDVSNLLVDGRDTEWTTDQLWDELIDVVNGKLTPREAHGESQFAIHRIGPST